MSTNRRGLVLTMANCLSPLAIELEIRSMLQKHLCVRVCIGADGAPSELMEVHINRPDGFGYSFAISAQQRIGSLDELNSFLREMLNSIVPKLLEMT